MIDTKKAPSGEDAAENLDPKVAGEGASDNPALASFGEVATEHALDLNQKLDAANARIVDLEATNELLAKALEDEKKALASANEALAKAGAALKAGKVSKGVAPKKLRKIGPISVADGVMPLSKQDLLELIGAADRVEVAFSDGKTEIAGLDPMLIEGNAWVAGNNGLMLNQALIVYGPAQGQGAFSLAGYGLMLDGDLIAYATRGQPLNIGAGGTFDLSNDVIF